MSKFNVISIEFDGIDKCGKDTMLAQFYGIEPNKYILNSRGLLSQIAYAKMFNRDFEYNYTKGYLDNTLFVYLTVDKDDWINRCNVSNEKQLNKGRYGIEGEVQYQDSIDCFEYAINKLIESGIDKRQILRLNTSELTPYKIIHEIKNRMDELNK